MAEAASSFRVSWNRFPSHVLSALDNLRLDEDFVDVSIYCGRRLIKAHRNVLSASSNYFKEIFKSNPSSHPVVILCDVDHASLRSLVDFMYHGEIEVPTARLDELLRLGEMLQVQGISSHKGLTVEDPGSSPSPEREPELGLEPPLPPGDVITPECVITEPSGAPGRRRRRSRRRTASAGEEAATSHVTSDGAYSLLAVNSSVTPAAGQAVTAVAHGSSLGCGLSPVGHPPAAAVGHGLPSVAHNMSAAGAGLSAADPAPPVTSADLQTAAAAAGAELGQPGSAADGSPLPQLRIKTEWPEEAAREPPPPPPPDGAADSKLLLDDSEQSGLDMSQYSGGIFAGGMGSRRPLTGAERARRYRERKKLKKLYEALLGGSPRHGEQLTVQL